MALDVVVSVLVLVVAAATCFAFTLGLLGEFGVVRLRRCPQCASFMVSLSGAANRRCVSCRHAHLTHPLRTIRHPVRELLHH